MILVSLLFAGAWVSVVKHTVPESCTAAMATSSYAGLCCTDRCRAEHFRRCTPCRFMCITDMVFCFCQTGSQSCAKICWNSQRQHRFWENKQAGCGFRCQKRLSGGSTKRTQSRAKLCWNNHRQHGSQENKQTLRSKHSCEQWTPRSKHSCRNSVSGCQWQPEVHSTEMFRAEDNFNPRKHNRAGRFKFEGSFTSRRKNLPGDI